MSSKPLLPLAAALAAALGGASDASEKPVEVGVFVEYIEIDERSARKLLRKYRGQRDLTAMRDELQRGVDEGKARIVSTAFIRTLAKQRAKVEAVDDVIYPTEYDPAETPQILEGPVPEGTLVPLPANPVAFEARPAGTTLEIDPVVGRDGSTIELNVAPTLTRYLGERSYGKEESEVTQPVFYSMRATTAITVEPGEVSLLGVHTPHQRRGDKPVAKPDPTRRCLVFIKAILGDRVEKGDEEK